MAAVPVGGANSGWWPMLWFLIKVIILLFCFIWLRGTLPRVRYDQLMALGWKVLIPVSIVWILLVATVAPGGWTATPPAPTWLRLVIVLIMVLIAMWDSAAQQRAARYSAIAEAPPPRPKGRRAEDAPPWRTATAFPVPPLDLPHYTASPSGHETSTREVTGA